MRSLTPTGLQVASLGPFRSTTHTSAVAVDPETGAVFLVVERKQTEGGIEVDIVKFGEKEHVWTSEVCQVAWGCGGLMG
jgi:hypothetical protein